MSKSGFRLFVTLIILGLAFSIAAAQNKGGGFSNSPVQCTWYENSYAFVVGINSYSHGWGRLSAGVSDAKKMAETLQNQGFSIEELYDKQATNGEIVRRLRQAAQQAGPNDRFVFYYSGHGYTQQSAFDNSETGYLVPVEGRSGDTTSYIPMDQLRTEIMNNCAAKHVLVIVDSCFSGTLLTRANIADADISDYLSKKGIYGITAGMQDQPAVDGLFTNVLVEGMCGNADFNSDGYVTFKELGMYAGNNVRAKNRHQTPDYGVMYGAGQFVFALAPREPASPEPVPVVYAQPAPTISDDYDTIIIEAKEREERTRKEKADTEARISRDYYKVTKILTTDSVPKEAKTKVCKKFLSDYSEKGQYRDHVDRICVELSDAFITATGRFQVQKCGSIIDQKTGLEWFVGPDKELPWEKAKYWVGGLKDCGGNWRMPTKNELATLYQKGVGTRDMHPAFETTGWWVWSSETYGSSDAWFFNFGPGREGWFDRKFTLNGGRAFAVRSKQ